MEKTETALILGGLAIVGVLVYLVYETGKGISDAATSGYNAYKQWHQSVFEGPEYGAQGATGALGGASAGLSTNSSGGDVSEAFTDYTTEQMLLEGP